MIKDIIIFGATGAGLDILELIRDINEQKKTYNFLGFLDDNKRKLKKANIIGNFSDYKKFKDKNTYFAIGIGNEKNFIKRSAIINKMKNSINKFPNLIHPSVKLAKDLKIGNGNIIHYGSIISRQNKIGNFNLILPLTVLSHDINLGHFNIINSNCIFAGHVLIKNNNYFGQSSNIRDNLKIGSKNLIAMGTVLVKSIKDKSKILFKNS